MSSASSLTKDCPRCNALLATETMDCACGYRFQAPVDESISSADLVTQAELLYETHIRAKLQRTQRALKLAKVDLLRDPANPSKRAQLREAEKEIRLVQTQLDVQSARIADARAHAERSRMESSHVAPAASVPSETFRASQAIKAEQTFEVVRSMQLAAQQLSASAASSSFSALQAEKAQDIVSQTEVVQVCPRCEASVALGAARCVCGYRVLAANDNAPGFLSTEELNALRGAS